MKNCDDVQKSALITLEQAVEAIQQQTSKPLAVETLPLDDCLNRTLAEDLVSTLNVPPADNSAMDGYAIRIEDLQASGMTSLAVTQRIAAGETGSALQAGTAARIFTGAPIPAQANAVVMQEVCEQTGDQVSIPSGITMAANIRRSGEDIKAGSVILNTGRKLRAQDIGLAASVGAASLKVYRRLTAAIMTTGDELQNPGTPLAPGQIYNSNRYTLKGLLETLDCNVIDIGQVEDTLAATQAALTEAALTADLIFSCGGVSVGEEDHVHEAVASLGEINLWKVALKPGKPCLFGKVDNTPFLGLPGNPVSVFITFLLLGRPLVHQLQGSEATPVQEFSVSAGFDWPRAGKRLEYLRARVGRREDGVLEATLYSNNSSGVLTSTVWADGLIVMPANTTRQRGDSVQYIPLELFSR